MAASTQNTRSPFKFFVMVYAFAIPFWILASISSVEDVWSRVIPMILPMSAFMFVVPIIAGLILTNREQGVRGMRLLLMRIFDFKRITHKAWYLPALLLVPIVVVLSYGVMRDTHALLPEPQIPILQIPLIFFIYFLSQPSGKKWVGPGTP